jgi:hypothetical protein
MTGTRLDEVGDGAWVSAVILGWQESVPYIL